MSRAFCIPAIAVLFCALVLSFIVSISLPYLPALDIVRVKLRDDVVISSNSTSDVFTQLRFGIWSACSYAVDETRTCVKTGHAYSVQLQMRTAEGQNGTSIFIGSSWTRGLAVHPFATGATFIAFLLAFSQNLVFTLIASIVSLAAATITLIAFAIDIALFAYVKNKMEDLNEIAYKTSPGPGFWLTFVTLILLLIGGFTVCLGRRKATAASGGKVGVQKTPFWKKWRKN